MVFQRCSRVERITQVPCSRRAGECLRFANTLDLRHFTHHGVQHQPAEELPNAAALGDWMQARGLIERGAVPSRKTFEAALRLRGSIRDYLQCEPAERHRKAAILESLDRAIEPFALRVSAGRDGMKLVAADAHAPPGLSAIVAVLHDAAANGTLDRLKMCAAEECRRVFFDRSKPATRRWCQSILCGNREKTRSYRERQRRELESGT